MKIAMILAAGRGERLKPLTELIPKAMCVVKGKPLIEHHVVNLARAGFDRVVINHAYLGGQIRQYLGDGSRFGIEICYSPEPPGGLETGGGIFNALPLLGDAPFVAVNADIYTDFNFGDFDYSTTETLHLILVKNNLQLKHHGDFGLIDDGYLTNSNPIYTYAGIACYHPRIFDRLKYGRYSLTPMMRDYAANKQAKGSLFEGAWFDIGTLERLRAADK